MADKGEYIIQDRNGEDLLVEKKSEYLKWLETRFADYQMDEGSRKKLRFDFDKCTGCSVGCSVAYFEGALFPRLAEDPEEMLMHGIMVDHNNSKINRILFCYSFNHLDKYA